MTDSAAGARLKQAIHVARARANILYDTDLAVRAGVHYDTLMNWFSGKTVPRGSELRKVGQVLGVAYADLMAAYEGRPAEPPPLQDAIKELVQSLSAQTNALTELVAALREGPPDPMPPLVERARADVAEAEASLERERAGTMTPRRRSGRERRGAGRAQESLEGETA